MAMNPHNIRIDDELWDKAVSRATGEGYGLSTLMRQWLADYAATGVVGGAHSKVRLSRSELESAINAVEDQFVATNIVHTVVDAVNKGR